MKKYDVRRCRIIRRRQLSDNIFDFTAEAGELAEKAVPGQFAQVAVPGKTLRRPISICEANRQNQTLRFVFGVRGEGTAALSKFHGGDFLDILAPLGNGFSLGDISRRALFVGGGIGVPPLLWAAKPFGKSSMLAAGFRTRSSIILKDDFESSGCKVLIATDDGSYGHHGLVTDLLGNLEFDAVFACGPLPMLRAVRLMASERGVPCQLSLEERMACGIGACLGCAVKLHHEDGTPYYGRVCRDGPVFDSRMLDKSF